jgi:hypothetical protein
MRISAIVACLAAWTATSDARIHRAWSYDELTAAADVIVIATPIATHDRSEHDTLPGITSVAPNGKVSPVIALRVETELRVVTVLKGNASASIVLHHYRDEPGDVAKNGPGFVAFTPKDKRQYLMFLTKDRDGQYVAVSGQTDPDLAIEPLQLLAP